MTIEEKINLLAEAEHFFADLSDAWEEAYKLWLRKAAALWTVKEALDLYKARILEDREWTEEDLNEALKLILRPEYIEQMQEQYEIKWEELEFYLGWFGLARWILFGNEEDIKGFRETQAAYDDLIEAKLWNKTLADIIWDLSKK